MSNKLTTTEELDLIAATNKLILYLEEAISPEKKPLLETIKRTVCDIEIKGFCYQVQACLTADDFELTHTSNLPDKYGGKVLPIDEWDAIKRNALDAIAMNPRLQAYAQFEIFINSNQAMTDDEIAELIGFKPPRNGYLYDCYQFNRHSQIHTIQSGCLVKQTTWKLEKVNIEKRNFLRQEVKQQRELIAERKEEGEAIAVYKDMKNALEI